MSIIDSASEKYVIGISRADPLCVVISTHCREEVVPDQCNPSLMILMTNKVLHPSTGSAYVMDGVAKITTVNAILFAFSSGCYGMKLRVVDIPVGCRPPKLTGVVSRAHTLAILRSIVGALPPSCFLGFCGRGKAPTHPFRRRLDAGRWCGCRGVRRVFRLVASDTFWCCVVFVGVGV